MECQVKPDYVPYCQMKLLGTGKKEQKCREVLGRSALKVDTIDMINGSTKVYTQVHSCVKGNVLKRSEQADRGRISQGIRGITKRH